MFSTQPISPRVFQRGATWRELKESWSARRELFLGLVQNVSALKLWKSALDRLEPCRLCVGFRSDVWLGLLSLPAIGNTLDEASHLEVRFFSYHVFFPELAQQSSREPIVFGRLNSKGQITHTWHQSEVLNPPNTDTFTTKSYLAFLDELDKALAKAFREFQG